MGDAAIAGGRELRFELARFRRPAGRPTRRTRTAARSSRTTSRPGPRLRRRPRSSARIARSPISSTASAAVLSSPQPIGSGSHVRPHAGQLGQQNLRERRAGPRAFVERQRAHFARRHAKVQLHAQHRPAAGDARIGNDRRAPAAAAIRPTAPAPRRAARRPANRPAGSAGRTTAATPVPQLLASRTPAACCSDN